MQISQAGDLFYQELIHDLNLPSDQCRAPSEATATGGRDPMTQKLPAQDLDKKRAGTTDDLEHSSEGEERHDLPPDLEVVIHDCPAVESESENCGTVEEDSSIHIPEQQLQSDYLSAERKPPALSAVAKSFCRAWIKAVIKSYDTLQTDGQEQETRPTFRCRNLFTTKELSVSALGTSPYQDARQRLRSFMTEQKVIQQEQLSPLETIPLPEAAQVKDWNDDVSQRLTAAWDGKWDDWWNEKLGRNKDIKIKALRENRRRQKLKRSGSQKSLSGSFASSGSFTSDFVTLSDPSEWSIGGISQADSQPRAEETATIPEEAANSMSLPYQKSAIPSSILKYSGNSTCRSSDVQNISEMPAEQTETRQSIAGKVSQVSVSLPSAPSIRSVPRGTHSARTPSGTLSSTGFFSSQVLRDRGIPKERRKTVQDFFSVLSNSEPMDSVPPTLDVSSSLPASFSGLESQSWDLPTLRPPSKRQVSGPQAKKKARMGF